MQSPRLTCTEGKLRHREARDLCRDIRQRTSMVDLQTRPSGRSSCFVMDTILIMEGAVISQEGVQFLDQNISPGSNLGTTPVSFCLEDHDNRIS